MSIDIEFTEKVSSIDLPDGDFEKENYPCKLSGWGSTSLGSSLPDKLQELELRVIAQDECKTVHNMLTRDHICTLTKTGEGACHVSFTLFFILIFHYLFPLCHENSIQFLKYHFY